MKRALIALALFAAGGASAQPEQRPVLKIAVTSGGQVITSDGRVRCHARCKASYRRGTILRLTAQPAANYLFVRWEGGCIGVAPICDIALDRAVSVRARFIGAEVALLLSVGGPGAVTGPSGLNCGGAEIVCGVPVRYGSTTTLTPVPSADGRFAAWGDGPCAAAGVGPCTLRIVGPTTEVAAAFGHSSPQSGPQTLNVNVEQASSARVTSDPAGIDCRPTCSASFPSGTLVTLRISTDDYWLPACQGDLERCLLVLDAPTEVGVRPRPPPPVPSPRLEGQLQVTVSGGGFVNSSDDAIRCGWSQRVETKCGQVLRLFVPQTKRLRAKTYRPGRFFSWGGVCSRAKPRCTITMTRPRNDRVQQFPVTALFRRR
jgi:hypothetical protein